MAEERCTMCRFNNHMLKKLAETMATEADAWRGLCEETDAAMKQLLDYLVSGDIETARVQALSVSVAVRNAWIYSSSRHESALKTNELFNMTTAAKDALLDDLDERESFGGGVH